MKTYETSKCLGNGAWKSCFALKGVRGKVALVYKGSNKSKALEELARELEELAKLADIGLPVVETFGIHVVKTGAATTYAIIAKRYLHHSKDWHGKFQDCYTDESVKDFDQMDKVLKEKNLQIHDLQFLIDRKGRVVISDPLGLKEGYYSYGGEGQVGSFRRKAVEVSSSKKASVKPVQPDPR